MIGAQCYDNQYKQNHETEYFLKHLKRFLGLFEN